MLATVISVFYIVLFLYSFYKKDSSFFILPIFVFCYPHDLKFINFEFGFGLDDLFIILHYLICQIEISGKVNPRLKKWKSLNLIILALFLLSNILGFWIDDFINFKFLPFFKASILFSYAYMICVIYCTRVSSLRQVHLGKLSLILAVFLQTLIAGAVYFDTDTFIFFYDSSEILKSGEVAFRAVGSLKGPWELGGFLSIGYVLVHSELISGHKSSKLKTISLILVLIFILYTVILSYSRASFLFILFSALFLFLRKTGKQIFYGVFIFFLIYFFFQDFFQDIIGRLVHRVEYTTSFNSDGLDNSSQQRFNIWRRLFEVYDVFYSLTGYGWRNFQYYFGTTPHNGFLSLFISSGLVGLVVYYHFFKTLWNSRWESVRKYSKKTSSFGIVSILVGLTVYSLTTDTLYTDAVFKMLTIIGSLLVIQKQLIMNKKVELTV